MAERDYVERTIATIRQHPKEPGWWPAAGHNLADYIAALEAELAAAQEQENSPVWECERLRTIIGVARSFIPAARADAFRDRLQLLELDAALSGERDRG